MNISIDLGNIWEMLAALSTTLAVIISLYLSFRESKKEIKVEIGINDYTSGYLITMVKSPNDYFLITEYGYKQWFKKISIHEKNVEILNANDYNHRFGLPIELLKENILKINLIGFNYNELLNKKVRFYVKDFEGKVYYSNKVELRELDKIHKLNV